MRRFGLNPKDMLESPELAKFASEYGAHKVDELLTHIGYGKLSARTVPAEGGPPRCSRRSRRNRESSRRSSVCCARAPRENRIKVRGTDEVLVFRAKCCNPIRGERIVGYITRGKGVSVHVGQLSRTC